MNTNNENFLNNVAGTGIWASNSLSFGNAPLDRPGPDDTLLRTNQVGIVTAAPDKPGVSRRRTLYIVAYSASTADDNGFTKRAVRRMQPNLA